jgi:hypothetical protein
MFSIGYFSYTESEAQKREIWLKATDTAFTSFDEANRFIEDVIIAKWNWKHERFRVMELAKDGE